MAQMIPQSIAAAATPTRALRMTLAAAVAIVLMLSLTAARAGAAPSTTYPPVTEPPSTIIIDPNANDDDIVEAGETVNFTVGGFKPGTEVCFYVEDQLVGCDIADENGFAEYDWTVPAGTASGDYDLQVEGVDPSGAPLTLDGTFHVETSGAFVPGDGSGGPLPYTGSDSATLVRIAVVLLLAGGVSVVAMRRRGARTNA
ncbi:MAG: LPXTG cell wall anchor domain-containing protein [Acidobacteria bacterium]|nr:LPXTG cell wall anchor domain-containing protein [Acidobacteriota bacterium]